MPLALKPPQEGRSPYWRIRGTYLGQYVDRSTGTPRKELAAKELARIKREIEGGRFAPSGGATFLDAASSYLKAGKSDPFLAKLMKRYGATSLVEIDQTKVDAWAEEMYPKATAATRNRQVYTPVAAAMHHAHPSLIATWLHLKRPEGSGGQQRMRWATPEQVAKLLEHADEPIRRLLTFLIATGCRLGEAVALEWPEVDLSRSFCYLGRTKNGDARGVHLPPAVVAELANIEPKVGRVFGFSGRRRVYDQWWAMAEAAGLDWFTPHHCCHTYATWMRVYAGLDLRGLVGTGRWKDQKSVARYTHVIASEEAKKADVLPIGLLPTRAKSGGSDGSH